MLSRAFSGRVSRVFVTAAVIAGLSPAARGQEPQERSVHQQQMIELGKELWAVTDDGREAQALERARALAPRPQAPVRLSATPTVDPDQFITFAWLQTEAVVYHLRWESLTHVGTLFVEFDSTGNISTANENIFLNRSSYIRAGGAAEAAGTKVHITLLNEGFSNAVTESVFTSAANRATLISEIENLINQDQVVNGSRYVHGVSFDLEPFSWSAAARDGLTVFFGDLRAALDSIDPNLEISWYVDPLPSSTQFDLPNQEPNIDFFLYSAYDFGTGTTPRAVSDFNNYITQINNFYLANGVPPEKMVVAISAYGRTYDNTNTYGVAGTASNTGRGWTDGRYDTTLNTTLGGPFLDNYATGDETAWYTFNDGIDRVVVWEGREGWEYKLRHVLSNQDSGGAFNGRRLGGIAFWSTLWLAEQSSYDMNTGTNVSRTRTYPEPYQLLQEILSPPGTRRFLITGFEGLDFRWRPFSPSTEQSPDNQNVSTSSTRAIVAAPTGSGQPANTKNAMQVNFVFTGSPATLFFKHEILATQFLPSVADLNAPAALLDSTTAIFAHIHTPAAYSGRQLRMVVVDGSGELEVSDPYTLDATGWREIEWDLTDPGQINGRTTSEAPFSSGDGVLNTAGAGERDIGFIGFLIEGGGAGSGTVTIDEVAYEHRNPGGADYVINEFRYDGAASEFVEVFGPPGPIPAGMQLRVYDRADGSVLASFNLSGTVPADGHFVVGDPGVPNVDSTTGFSAAVDDLSDGDPTGLQLYNTSTGGVYDSVVYEAWGGLDDLIRRETHGVTDEGWPWIGRIGPGTDGSGAPHTFGRYPDGTDTDVNNSDFSAMVATPGAANGGAVSVTALPIDFTSVPPGLVQTFQSPTVVNPTSAGLPSSPNGGNAYRCVDTSGGGVQAFLGDAALGSDGLGYTITGEIYIPSSAEPAQAIAIGLCGSQGSTFFSGVTDSGAYEDGYWLIYENVAGVGLNDGRPDHAGVFEFVHATNDNMDANPVDLLASVPRTATGAPDGGWTTFSLTVNPPLSGQQLIIQINGADIYRGNLPAGGPISGAFQVGFRENHSGTPVANEGTWIDNVDIGPAIPVGLSLFGTE